MNQIDSIEILTNKKSFSKIFLSFFNKIFGTLELLIILGIWVLVFSSKDVLGDFTRAEMITYIIFGNLIGIIFNYLLQGVLYASLGEEKNKLFLKNPFLFLIKIFFRGFGQNFLFFVFLGITNLLLVCFFMDKFVLNTNKVYLIVIGVMVFFGFLSDFLVIYLVRLFAFWSLENQDSHLLLSRLKRLIAGNYFPLSLLPASFLSVSFILPFPYSFFVPAELYLGKIDLRLGIQGIVVQLAWIVVIYYVIKFISYKRENKKKLKTEEMFVDSKQNNMT